MLGRSFRIFRAFGVDIRIDASWFIIFVLIVWSLATGWFPAVVHEVPRGAYWAMGVFGALGLFVSLVVHELGHAVTAQQYGVTVRGITLFLFGGVAEMEKEPPRPGAEFWVAIAGPITSVLISFFAAASYGLGTRMGWAPAATEVLRYLAWINIVLVAFNMIPAFPLDGGRVLRSALWKWKNNLRWATRVTSNIGAGFGVALIVIGVIAFLGGNAIGGMWWFLIGLFLRHAALMSYQQLLVRRALEGESVRHLMNDRPQTVPAGASIQDLVDDYVYKYHHKMYPVIEDGKLVGCVSLNRVKEVPREQWPAHSIGELTEPCSPENTIAPDADAMDTLSKMNRLERSRLLVVDHDHLEGVVSLKDLMKFISLKVELE